MTDKQVKKLKDLSKKAEMGGGVERIKKQHQQDKLTARERIALLMDEDSFIELDKFILHRTTDFGLDRQKVLGDGVITGYGNIHGRLTYVFAQDFTVFGGSLGEMHATKICKIMDLAAKNGAPIIGLNDSAGARIQEGVGGLGGYGDVFHRNVKYSGLVPQISAIMGPCAGGAVYSPAITDFIFMVKGTSYMFITGPKVVKTVTGEDVTFETLGGANVHSEKSGVAHFIANNDKDCIKLIRKLMSYLPQNNLDDSPVIETESPRQNQVELLNTIIPESPNKPYDMHKVIEGIVDKYSFFEVHQNYAQNIIVGFSRIDGRTVGVIGNQPSVLAGTLDINASDKASRFVRFCDAFNIPLLTLMDVPGFLPGVGQEHGGIIRHGAKILYAYSEATVPKITVITRKAYGGAYVVLCSRHVEADLVFAWPSAELAVMGATEAINVIFRKEISKTKDPESLRKKKLEEYRKKFANPYIAANRGFIDKVILPSETRQQLIQAYKMLHTKRVVHPRRKHGNIPL